MSAPFEKKTEGYIFWQHLRNKNPRLSNIGSFFEEKIQILYTSVQAKICHP